MASNGKDSAKSSSYTTCDHHDSSCYSFGIFFKCKTNRRALRQQLLRTADRIHHVWPFDLYPFLHCCRGFGCREKQKLIIENTNPPAPINRNGGIAANAVYCSLKKHIEVASRNNRHRRMWKLRRMPSPFYRFARLRNQHRKPFSKSILIWSW